MKRSTALLLAVHLGRRVRRRPVGYTAIGLAAFASWAGLPGPGEAAVIAGAAFAARNRLDIVQVELYSFLGATVGGMIGWRLGWHFGAALAERPGPLFRLRKRGLRAGERFFERFGAVAVMLTPSWVAGIHRVPPGRFIFFNAVASAGWAAVYGLTTYFAGPGVADFFSEISGWAAIGLVAVALTLAGLALLRRRRTRAGSEK